MLEFNKSNQYNKIGTNRSRML